jgi:hypothetical protein
MHGSNGAWRTGKHDPSRPKRPACFTLHGVLVSTRQKTG